MFSLKLVALYSFILFDCWYVKIRDFKSTINENIVCFFIQMNSKNKFHWQNIYILNQVDTYMLYSRNIIVHESKKEKLLTNNKKYYELHKIGIDFGWHQT